MRAYVGHTSALEFQRHDSNFRFYDGAYPRVPRQNDEPRTSEELSWIDFEPLGLDDDELICLIVSDELKRFQRTRFDYLICKQELPYNAFLEVRRDICVASPELVFLQMAPSLEFSKLVRIGCELCGTYSMRNGQELLCKDIQTTTREKLISFIDACVGIRGIKKARTAASYVFDGAASPMETMLAMMLSLPLRYGGYGLPRPELNVPVSIRKREGLSGMRQDFVLDLYWRKARLDVEYDGAAYHTGAERIAADADRRNLLRGCGISQMTVTGLQLCRLEHLETLAAQIASALHVTLREPNCKQMNMRYELHQRLLPRHAM